MTECVQPKLFDFVTAYLDDEEWRYEIIAEGQTVLASVRGDNGTWSIAIEVGKDADDRRILVHSIFPVRTPQARRVAVAELIARINFSLIIGNFELDMNDGEIRFKTSLNLADGRLTRAMFECLLLSNFSMMDEYWQNIMSVAYGGLESANLVEAIAEGAKSVQ
jgi:hypothetical protein